MLKGMEMTTRYSIEINRLYCMWITPIGRDESVQKDE